MSGDSPTASTGPFRMAATIETILRRSQTLSALRSAGLTLSVSADEAGVGARTVSPPGRSWPPFGARISGARWWEPEGTDHANRIATHLAAELRMKWDRWVAGVDDAEE